jgi:tetratricopeptide (TPR) repeat protein
MKKILLLSVLAFLSAMSIAQSGNLKKAKSLVKGESPKFEEAAALVDAALKDESTKNAAETWYVKGYIEFKKWEFQDDKRYLVPPETPDATIMSEAAYKAYQAWVVADSLDAVESKSNPDRKGKMEFRKEMAEKLIKMKKYMFNYGANLFAKEDYEGAKMVFHNFSVLPDLDMFKGNDKIIPNDSLFHFARINEEGSFRQIVITYNIKKDSVNYLKSLKEGVTKYPDSIFYLFNMVQYNLDRKNYDEAIKLVNGPLERQPNNYQLYNLRGKIYLFKSSYNEALTDFSKVMELKPSFSEAVYLYGTATVFLGDEAYSKAQLASKGTNVSSESKKAKELHLKGISYLEKAYGMKLIPSETIGCLRKLKETYFKLNNIEKYKEYDKLYKEATSN